MKKSVFFLSYLLIFIGLGFSQELSISPSDLRLEPEVDFGLGSKSLKRGEITGYHLYIRKLDGIESVMLTESYKDPDGKVDNYAYRALEYNEINGDEIRYLDGKVLNSKYAKYSLIDSTAEKDEKFGYAFHIYIPLELQFGYSWARNGLLTVGKATFINIRAYSKKYADYSGSFKDTPFLFDLGKKPSYTQPLTETLVNEIKTRNENKRNEIKTRLNDDSKNVHNVNKDETASKSSNKYTSSSAEVMDAKSFNAGTSENAEKVSVEGETVDSSSSAEVMDAKSFNAGTSENAEKISVEGEAVDSSSSSEVMEVKSFNAGTSENAEKISVEGESEDTGSEKSILLGSEYYNKEASESFSRISGSTTFSLGPESIVGDIMKSVNSMSSSEDADLISGDASSVGVNVEVNADASMNTNSSMNTDTSSESNETVESNENDASSSNAADSIVAAETNTNATADSNSNANTETGAKIETGDAPLNENTTVVLNTDTPSPAPALLSLVTSSSSSDKKNKKNDKKNKGEVSSDSVNKTVETEKAASETKPAEEKKEELLNESSGEFSEALTDETVESTESNAEAGESIESALEKETEVKESAAEGEKPSEESTETETEGVEQEIESTEVSEASKKKDYSQEATDKFSQISENLTYSHGPESIVSDVAKIFTPEVTSSSPNADIVFVIDATGSMMDDIEELRKSLIPQLESVKKHFKNFRVGLVLYRDYGDDFAYYGLPIKVYEFASDLNDFRTNLNDFVVKGSEGGDIPEAVYEGLYGALALFQWDKTAMKKIILIGDAEPHPKPRGVKKISQDLVQKLAKQKGVQIDAIITPDGRIHK